MNTKQGETTMMTDKQKINASNHAKIMGALAEAFGKGTHVRSVEASELEDEIFYAIAGTHHLPIDQEDAIYEAAAEYRVDLDEANVTL